MAKPDRLDQILVERQSARHCARDRRYLQRVRQARPVMVAERRHEHLGLVRQAPERLAVHDPVAIALKRACAARSPPPGAPGAPDRSAPPKAIARAPPSPGGARRRPPRGAPCRLRCSRNRLWQRLRLAPRSFGLGGLRLVADIKRTCAWCSSVSDTARSTCPSTRSSASSASLRGRPNASAMNSCADLPNGKGPGLASAADNASRGAREANQMLTLPASCARSQLRRQSRRDQQLQAKRQGACSRRLCRASSSRASLRHSRLNTPG